MFKQPKRSRKRTPPNPQDTLQEDSTTDMQWTPLQLEQIELAKQLDLYISNFQKKLLLLNFKPSERELIILFIMNLHPRWRRFIEPMELSLATWLDAAKYAKRHCLRVSAMLGCDVDSPEGFFQTAESKTLRDCGFFAQDFNLSGNVDSSIKKLLIPSKQQQDNLSEVPTPELKSATTSTSSSSSFLNVQPQQPKETTKIDVNKEQIKKQETLRASTSSEQTVRNGTQQVDIGAPINQSDRSSKTPNGTQNSTKTNNTQKEPETANGTQNNYGSLEELIVEKLQEKTKEDIKLLADACRDLSEKNTVTAPNGKDKEVLVPISRGDNVKDIARIPVMREEDVVDGSDKIIENIPPEHRGVNLTFLELTVNGKKVRALLAKMRWGSSAISMDCAKRLELPLNMCDKFGVLTDFGYVDADGDMDFPIQHPADPTLKQNLRVCILPKIYGGQIDLVLGADFFFYFNPALNIQKRTISFLGKETPYLVNKLT